MTPIPISPQPLFASLDASVITLDLDGYVLAWSRGAARLFGYDADDIIGKHILVLYADEDDHDAELFNTVLTQGSGEMEVKRRRKKWRDLLGQHASVSGPRRRGRTATPDGVCARHHRPP